MNATRPADLDPDELERLADGNQNPNEPLALSDFLAYLPEHKFIHRPTGALWPADSLNGALSHVEVDGKPILKGLNLTIEDGSVHAIMGPNGSGKSTLAAVVAGKPGYEITGEPFRWPQHEEGAKA